MEEQESLEFKELEEKLVQITNRLKNVYNLSVTEISKLIREPYDSFNKYAKGQLPETKPEKIKYIIAELEKLEQSQKQERESQDLHSSLGNAPASLNEPASKSLQCIYFPLEMKPEPYDEEFEVSGFPTKVKGTEAIIAEPNDSKHFEDAEGLVPAHDPAAESYDGCKIAIKRININKCIWGSGYYIIDTSNQTYLRKLYQDAEGLYRLVAKNPVNHPDKTLHKSEIAVVFRVICVFTKSQIQIFHRFSL